MKMKKVLSAALASVIAISTLSPAFAANIQPTGYHHAYLSGVGNGRFEPARNMTRAEAVVMLTRLYYYTDGRGYSPTFADTEANQWYSSYLGWAQANGFLENSGTFRPHENVTRAEYLDFLFRFQKVNVDGNAAARSFSDLSGVSAKTKAQIAHAVSKGWISGYSDGTFRPNAAIQRDEVTSMTNRVVGRLPDKQHIAKYLPSLTTFADVSASNWAYFDVLEASNSHTLYGMDAAGEVWSVRPTVTPDKTPTDDDGDDDSGERYRIRAVDGDHGVIDGKKTFYTNRSGKITDLPEVEADDGYVFVKWIDRKMEKRVKIGNILEKDITIEPVFERDSDDEDDMNHSRIIRFTDGENGEISDTSPRRTNRRGVVPTLPHVTPNDGYTFSKWINADTGRTIQAGDIIYSNIVLMPVFTASGSSETPPKEDNESAFTISFVSGEHGDIDDMSPVQTEKDGVIAVLPGTTAHEGYTFSQWVNHSTGEPVSVGDKLTGDVSLRPVFVKIEGEAPDGTHTITPIDGDHGTLPDKSPVQTNPDGTISTLPDVIPDDGYELDKWVKIPGGEAVKPGDKLAEDATIQPVFKEQDNTHTITPTDGDHGTISNKTPIQTDKHGVVSSLPEVVPDEGYIFDKWVKVPGGEEVKLGDKLDEDATIQPIFKEQDNTRIITPVDGEHGTIPDKTPIQTDKHGVVDSLPEVIPDEGYDFEKWVRVPSGEVVKSGDKLTEDVAIQPIFKERDNTRTITPVDGEHGTIPDKTPIQTDKHGVIGSLPEVVPDDGYDLEKWVKVPSGEEVKPGDKLDGDATIQPILKEQDSTRTIIPVDGDHGMVLDKTPIQTDKHGVVGSLPEVAPDEGYIFDKWVKVPGGEEVKPGDKLDDDATIQPIFKEQDNTHIITPVDGEHGTVPDKTPIQTDKHGVVGSLPEVTPDEGYTLDKWVNVSSDEDIQIGSKLEEDITIKPVFREISYKITIVQGEHGTVSDLTPLFTASDGKIPALPETAPDYGYTRNGWEEVETGVSMYKGKIITSDITIRPAFRKLAIVTVKAGDGYTLSGKTEFMVDASGYLTESIADACIVTPTKEYLAHYDNQFLLNETGKRFWQSSSYREDTEIVPDIRSMFNTDGQGTITEINSSVGWDILRSNGGKLKIPNEIMGETITKVGKGSGLGYYNSSARSLIQSVTFASGIEEIADETFKNCEALTGRVTFPNTLKRIGANAFRNTAITGLSLPESITAIGDYAFEYNDKLSWSIDLPDQLEEIGVGAFSNCKGIYGTLRMPDILKNDKFYRNRLCKLSIIC